MPERTPATDGGYFAPLASAKYMLLTTFTRDGVHVATRVCGVVDGDRAYFRARSGSGPAKRLRHIDAVQVAPCGVFGFFVHGSTLDAIALPLSGEEASLVAAKLDRHHPFRRRFLTPGRRGPVYYELLANDAGDDRGGPPTRAAGRSLTNEEPSAPSLVTSVHTSQRFMPAGAAGPSSLATVYMSSTNCRPSERTRITTVSMSLPAPSSVGA